MRQIEIKAQNSMNREKALVQIRLLIKKYHPDVCPDSALLGVYSEISLKLLKVKEDLEKGEISPSMGGPESKPLRKKDEKDFHYYQLGMSTLKLIHPSRFYKSGSRGVQTPLGKEEQKIVLEEIRKAIEESMFYFGEVAEKYPHSPWVEDSKQKIELLTKLKIRYSHFEVSTPMGNTDMKEFMERNGVRMI